MSEHLPVLIIGAGPSGLMMAAELARHGVSFRIIDKKPEPTLSSNATWIQTRTLEIFNQLGLADHFLKAGHPCDAINLYTNGKLSAKIPFSSLDSTYPFILTLAQAETERILIEHLERLKGQVERSLELIDVKQENNRVISKLKYADGHTETITSDWLIACDGANSTIREKSGIIFQGKDLPEQFMVADTQMGSYLPNNEMHVFFDKGTIFPEKGTLFAAFPCGSNKYRINANLYLDAPRQSFTAKEVKEVVTERTYGNYTIESVSWISPFWIHDKIVNNMRNNSIFLVGDAAHIHSPAGGQGMNSGIQDAYNLAWKLALVIKEQAKPSLLDSYQLERYPIMNEIVKQTGHLTEMALFDSTFYEKLHTFCRKISKSPPFANKIAMQVTQLSLQYHDSPIINYEKKLTKSPKQGERAPDVKINPSMRLSDYLRNTQHNVLLFTGLSFEKNNLQKIITLETWLTQNYPNLIRAHLISTEKNGDADKIIFDSNNAIHNAYHMKKPALYILRPDNTIAYYSNKFEIAPIEQFLESYLVKS